ncbi:MULTISPECIES: hypothetical protein [unclassified Bradyrhizobium]|uniref:hypothetical protein n=1 Tax=Bradyrhizobium sp. USDA 4538 TaxID=2817702 RepID=UPI0035C73347
MAEHRADVIKVEVPAGDETRDLGAKLPGDRSSYRGSPGMTAGEQEILCDLRAATPRAA